MGGIDQQDLRAVLEIIRVADLHLEVDQLRQDAIKAIHKAFKSHSCNFFLTDQHSKLIDPIGVNLEHRYLSIYQSHFFRFNPFDPINLERNPKATLTDEELFSLPDFFETEYFNDFLKPQEVYRQMVVYLRSAEKILGFIGLHRRKGSAGFGKREVRIGMLIAPHLVSALEKAEMFSLVKEKGGFFKAICDCTSFGKIVLDAAMRPVYANDRAIDICARITGQTFRFGQKVGECVRLPTPVCDDCAQLGGEIRSFPNTIKPLYRQRTITGSEAGRYTVRSEVMDENLTKSKGPLFLITIQNVSDNPVIDPTRLKEEYGLTNREVEIVDYTQKGLKNSEIAGMLCISEGTVKNHLKSIFRKVGVDNRASLIHEALAI